MIHPALRLPREHMQEACRQHFQCAYVGDHTLLCRILVSNLIYCDSRDVSLSPHLAMNGYWESWITKAFINTIQPGWVVYDVGASWGYYSILFWELVGHSGRVFSVEPHARALELLPQSIQVNGFTPEIVSRAAWGASNESIGFHALTHFQGGSAVSPTGKETVQTIRLDELPYTPNLIKLDVEGAEHHVWEGLGVILDTPGIIIAMEVGRRDYGDTFLHKVKDRFKLRAVTPESTLRNITIDEIQALGDGAWEMLWLTR